MHDWSNLGRPTRRPGGGRRLGSVAAVSALAVLLAGCTGEGVSSGTHDAAVTPFNGGQTGNNGGTGQGLATPAANAVLVYRASGTGSLETPTFEVEGPWRLSWSFSCSGQPGGRGSFVLAPQTQDGQDMSDVQGDQPVSQRGGGASGSVVYTIGQSLSLGIRTTCSWELRVDDIPTVGGESSSS